jgi:hypothetical protein
MSAFNSADLVESPRRVYIGKAATATIPAAPPANTAVFGGPHTGWRLLGYTSREPLSLGAPSAERTPILSGEQRGQVRSVMGEVNESVSFRILSRTMQNIKEMAGRGILSQIAAGVGTPGETKITWSDQPDEQVALLIEAYGTQGRLWRAYYPVGMFAITDALQIGYGPDAMQSGIAVTFTAEGGPDNPPWWKEIIPATS